MFKRGTEIFPYADGGAQEAGLRAGTENIASIVAMAAALKNNCLHISENEALLTKTENTFLHALNESGVDYIRNGFVRHVPGNVNVSFKNADGEMLLHRLDLKGICISTGSACDSKNTQISHVIKAINVPEDYATGTIRVSFGKYNSPADAIAIAGAIVDILKSGK